MASKQQEFNTGQKGHAKQFHILPLLRFLGHHFRAFRWDAVGSDGPETPERSFWPAVPVSFDLVLAETTSCCSFLEQLFVFIIFRSQDLCRPPSALPSQCHRCCFRATPSILLTALYRQTFYVWKKDQQNKSVFASNFIPLWAGLLCSADSRLDKAVHALNVSGLLHSAGIATSLKETGQQWDFPNAWPPLQHMIIEGLALSGSKEAAGLAKTIALYWLQTNYAVYQTTEHMLEKYNATVCGGTGGGGEYNLQTGFGWSNGVILSLLNDFEWSWDDFHACSLSSLNEMTMPFNCLQNGVDI